MDKELSSSFEVRTHFEQRINKYHRIHLSLSQNDPPNKKNLTVPEHTKIARKTPQEHLTKLNDEGRISNLKQPLMVLSVRNVLSNLRCIAYIKGFTKGPISTLEEYKYLKTAQSGILSEFRPYHVLGSKNGCLTIEEWHPSNNIDFDWFISGVPVLWDDEENDIIYQRIVTEAADHSHVWHIPRGNHPEANPSTSMHWRLLQEIFIKTLTTTRKKAFFRIEEYIKKNELRRENAYLHNVIGVDEKGRLCQIVKTDRLEDLGQKIKELGVCRAICVDNSGSITIEFYPGGISGAQKGEFHSLIAAPNHRLPGTAYLIIELEDSNFSYL